MIRPTLLLSEGSTPTYAIFLLALAPFVFMIIMTWVFWLRRRGSVSMETLKSENIVSSTVPTGTPTAEVRGGAWIGGVGVSWPFVTLMLFPQYLVLKVSLSPLESVVVSSADVLCIRVDRSAVGPSLKVVGLDGRDMYFSFRAFRSRSLREAITSGGWGERLCGREDV